MTTRSGYALRSTVWRLTCRCPTRRIVPYFASIRLNTGVAPARRLLNATRTSLTRTRCRPETSGWERQQERRDRRSPRPTRLPESFQGAHRWTLGLASASTRSLAGRLPAPPSATLSLSWRSGRLAGAGSSAIEIPQQRQRFWRRRALPLRAGRACSRRGMQAPARLHGRRDSSKRRPPPEAWFCWARLRRASRAIRA